MIVIIVALLNLAFIYNVKYKFDRAVIQSCSG